MPSRSAVPSVPDHLHVLLRLDQGGKTSGTILGAFKRYTTRQGWSLGYQAALWQGQFYDHIMQQREDGEKIAAYTLANPARKGLVAKDDEYPYSGMPDPL